MNFIGISLLFSIVLQSSYAQQEKPAVIDESSIGNFQQFMKDEDRRIEDIRPKNNIYDQAKNAPEQVPAEALEVFKLEKLRNNVDIKDKPKEEEKIVIVDPLKVDGVKCYSATNQEYLGNSNGYFCGGNWTYPLYIPRQAHINEVTLELDVTYRTDFLETIIFEDKNPTKVKSRKRNRYSKSSIITISSKKYNSLNEYFDNFHEILKNENKKIYKMLHDEHKDGLIKYFSSNYRINPNIKSVVFDSQTPVFSSPPGPLFNEDEILSRGKGISYAPNSKFLGLLSSSANPDLINANYFVAEEETDFIQDESIRLWFPSSLVAQDQEQICLPYFNKAGLTQSNLNEMSPIKSTLQILDDEKDYRENGMQLLVATAYCIAEASSEINSQIQADKWHELYRKYGRIDCEIGEAPVYRTKDFQDEFEGELLANTDDIDSFAKKLQVKQDLLDRAFFGDEMGNIKEVDPQDVVSEILFDDNLKGLAIGENGKDIIENTLDEEYDPSQESKPMGSDIPDGFYDDPNTQHKEKSLEEINKRKSNRRKI